MPRNAHEDLTLVSAIPSAASEAPPPRSAPADRRIAWVALGFGGWITLGLVLALWAIDQGVADHPFASPYHIPAYAGLVTLCVYCAARLVISLRRGTGWRGTLESGYGTLAIGAITAVVALILELGWREGIGINLGIEENIAPTRVAVSLALFLVAVAPLRAALLLEPGRVPRLPMLLSAGLALAVIGLAVRFHPAVNPWFEDAGVPQYAPAELWVMDANGSHQTRILETNDPAIGYGYASWSADGAQIVYSRFDIPDMDETRTDADIWTMAPDGTGSRQLAGGEGMQWIPKLSHDAHWVAYTQESAGGPWANPGPVGPGPGAGPVGGAAVGPLSVPLAEADLWQQRADGSGAAQRLSDSPADDRAPVYSPDGSMIVFDSTRDGNTEIYVLDLATMAERRLTNDPGEDWGASWSPDGERIAFNSSRSGAMNVFVMAADGSNVRQITYAVGSVGDLAPSWTPDGANLVYTERIGDAGQGEVWSIPSGGGRPVNLTRSEFAADEAWTGAVGPDGRIVFSRSLQGPPEVSGLAREDLGAAAMLLSALLVAMMAVVVVQAGWTFGSLTLVCGIAVALVAIPAQEWRFAAIGLAVGLVADVAVWRSSGGLRPRIAGAVAGAALVIAFGLATLATSRLGWSPTLLIGVATAASVVGWGIGAIGSIGQRRERTA